MTLRHYYDGTLLTNAVLISEEHGFAARAEVGQADIVRVVVEDPDGTLDFAPEKRWVMKEDACPAGAQVVWSGWVAKQSISRGGDTQTIYPTGSGRRWELDLVEANTCLGFRVITGTDGKRPAETATARLGWLLRSAYLADLVRDYGLVASSAVTLDAHDYRGQTPIDVLSELAVATGYNFFVRYREASDDFELAFYAPDTSILDSGSTTFRISNDPADVDYATTWPAAPTLTLERDPSRLARGIYLPYSGGAVYVGGGPGQRDMVAPTAAVKSATTATALAERLLAQHSEQDERLVRVRCQLPAANLNDVRPGQRISVRQVHLPGWTSFRPARVVSKAFSRPPNLTQGAYDVDLELSPAHDAVASFARLSRPNDNEVTSGTGKVTARLRWDRDGDNPQAGDPYEPRYGLVDYYPSPKPAIGWQGIKIGGSGKVTIRLVADFIVVISGTATATWEIRRNGSEVLGSQIQSKNAGGNEGWVSGCDFTVSDVLVQKDDVIEGWVTLVSTGTLASFTIPAGVGDQAHQLRVTGTVIEP